MEIRKQSALEYHRYPRPGKISITPTKPSDTQMDLSLAYSPGVAEACLEIVRDPSLAGSFTTRSNLVAVVSNGSAVLGLGNIGPLAGKPVMEGKAVLFKRFADIDVFDLEINTTDPEEIVRVVELLEPTFGGVNLEDIKAPECFYVEEQLRKRLQIPVFHDDQHGTAIISGAALLNAAEIAGKDLRKMRVVINGAGASGIACATLYLKLGVNPESLVVLDSRGVIYRGRTEGMNPYKSRFARETPWRTLREAIRGADAFIGLSKADVLTPGMLLTMAETPVRVRPGEPGPGNRIRQGHRCTARCNHRHGPLRLSQSGEQCPVLPVAFPGSPGCRGPVRERCHAARRRALARRSRQAARAGFGTPDLHLRAARFRAALHHSQAVRPAGNAAGRAPSRRGSDPERGGQEADRTRRLPGEPSSSIGQQPGSLPDDPRTSQGRPALHCAARGESREDSASRLRAAPRAHRQARAPGRPLRNPEPCGAPAPSHQTGGTSSTRVASRRSWTTHGSSSAFDSARAARWTAR